ERSEGVGARAGEAEHDPSPTRWREEQPPSDTIEITLYSASAEQPRPDPLAALREREGVVGLLSELVEVEPQLRELVDTLLGETVVVDRLARALELWHRTRRELPTGARS